MQTLRERVLAKVQEEDRGYRTRCWIWQDRNLSHGYAYLTVAGRRRRAHRVSYEAFRGPIPGGLPLDHLCDQRACVNPRHLKARPIGENVLRGRGPSAVNARKRRCKRGHLLNRLNTRIDRRGKRVCRPCHRRHQRRYRRAVRVR